MSKFMELQVCASNHEAVCYYNNYCPMCDAQRQVDEHCAAEGDLLDQLHDCELELDKLRAELRKIKEATHV